MFVKMYILKNCWGKLPPAAKKTHYNRFFSILMYPHTIVFYPLIALCVIVACTLVTTGISSFHSHHSAVCVKMYNFCYNVSDKLPVFQHLLMSSSCKKVSATPPVFRYQTSLTGEISLRRFYTIYTTLNDEIAIKIRTIKAVVCYLKLLNMKVKSPIFKLYGYGGKESWWREGGVHSGQ